MSFIFNIFPIFFFSFFSSENKTEIFIDDYCIYENEYIQNCTPNADFSYSTDPKILANYDNLLVPVVFWGINKDDGTSESQFTLAKAEESIALLNTAFKDMNLRFEIKSFNTINGTDVYWTDYSKFNRYMRNNKLGDEDALNIYVPFRFTNFEDNLRGGKWSWNQLSVNHLNYNTGILPHEVGHIFGLNHMHSGQKGQYCERVTRDEKDPNYNAKCRGDLVTDTNAMPNLYSSFHLITDNCEYIGKQENCKGETYNITVQDVRNFMGYTKHECRTVFTVGQGIRAREFIDKYRKSNQLKFLFAG